MRKSQGVLLTSLLVLALSAGNVSAADTTGATVDAQQLFHADKLVTDTAKTKTVDARQVETAAEAVGQAVPHPLLHWDSVEKQPKEIKKSEQPLVVVHTAVPIIITAADIDAENKEAKHQNKSRAVVPIQPPVPVRSLPPETQPAPIEPPVVTPKPVQQVLPAMQTSDSHNTVELPPIEPVGQKKAGQAVKTAEKTVALPPIEPVPAARIKAVAAPTTDTVELPPIRPVQPGK